MAIDIWQINSGNPINNYSVVTHIPSVTGITPGTIYEGRVYNKPEIADIQEKYQNRWDEIDPTSPT